MSCNSFYFNLYLCLINSQKLCIESVHENCKLNIKEARAFVAVVVTFSLALGVLINLYSNEIKMIMPVFRSV